jgi:OmpA-OmpF porin, OOP family
MSRTKLLLSALVFLHTALFAQNNTQEKSSKSAKVNISVTDYGGKAFGGTQVLFSGEKTMKTFSGKTNAAGRFTLELPAGDQYIINLKALGDTTKYGIIDIPALKENQEYTQPFTVDIQYEPAKTFTLDNVHFDFGKATLRQNSYAELNELVDFLLSRDDIKIEIGGHTDNIGKDADNLSLSRQRANTIRNYILKKGIKAQRVSAKGYGAALPVADNETEQGRQLNRRTEVKIL